MIEVTLATHSREILDLESDGIGRTGEEHANHDHVDGCLGHWLFALHLMSD